MGVRDGVDVNRDGCIDRVIACASACAKGHMSRKRAYTVLPYTRNIPDSQASNPLSVGAMCCSTKKRMSPVMTNMRSRMVPRYLVVMVVRECEGVIMGDNG